MKASRNHLPSLLNSILFILGGLLLSGIALFMGITALASSFLGTEMSPGQLIFLVAFGFEAAILFAAAYFVLQKYLRKDAAEQGMSLSISSQWMFILALIASTSILAGYLLRGLRIADWLLLPVLTVPAIVFPLAVLLGMGTYGLPLGPRWQAWSVLGLGMTLGPILLFALEILLAIFIFIGVAAYVMTQPGLVLEMQRLSEQIMILGAQPEQAAQILAPFLTKPAVIVLVLLYIAVLVPALEELFKPIGIWLFARDLNSTAQGFALGALSGAGYALIETIGVSGQQTGEWAALLFSRIGTGLLHITTSALVGMAIVSAWHERRYLRFVGTYLLAVLLHGLWNAGAMLFTFSTLAEFLDRPGELGGLQSITVVALAVLSIALFSILVVSNRRLRRTSLDPSTGPVLSMENRDALDKSS